MEPLALLPTELTALVDPLARTASPRLGAQDGAGAVLPGADAFAQFLAAFLPPLTGGQELPTPGKPLPLPLPEGEAALAAPDSTGAATADETAAPLATTAGLAVWLALQRQPVSTTTLPSDATDGRALATAPTPAAPLPAAGAAVPLPVPPSVPPLAIETAGAAEAPATTTAAAPPPLELPTTDLDSDAVAEVLGGISFDVMEIEARSAANQPRVEARPVTPLVTESSTPAPAAAWLASRGEAAGQAAARATDSAGSAGRGMRRLETVAVTSAPGPIGEPASLGAADWLPPAVATGTSGPSAPAAAIPLASQQAPVDTRAPQWHEAFASRVQWLVDQQVGEARIKLNPPELGAVDVKISLVEDKTYVQLTAATAAARDELTQGLQRLRDLFVASGMELGGASVQSGRGEHSGGGGYEAAPRHGVDTPEPDLALPPEPSRAGRRGAGAIDVFA